MVTSMRTRWELYHLDSDVSEMNDLAAQHPEKLRELVDMWWADAERYQVLPLDDSLLARLLVERPRVFEPRDVYSYTGRVRLPRQGSPVLRDRSYTISADVDIDDECRRRGDVVRRRRWRHRPVRARRSRALRQQLPRSHAHRGHLARPACSPARSRSTSSTNDGTQRRTRAPLSRWGVAGRSGRSPAPTLSRSRRPRASKWAPTACRRCGTRYRPPFEFTGDIRRVVVSTPSAGQPLTRELASAEHRMAMLRQ